MVKQLEMEEERDKPLSKIDILYTLTWICSTLLLVVCVLWLTISMRQSFTYNTYNPHIFLSNLTKNKYATDQ